MRLALFCGFLALSGCGMTEPLTPAVEITNSSDSDLKLLESENSSSVNSLKPELTAVDEEYLDLVTKIKVLPSYDDVVKLKALFIQTQFYQPFVGNEQLLSDTLAEQINTSLWKACLETSKQLLNSNYLSLNAHYSAMACSVETKQIKRAAFHKKILNFLLEDLWGSGNGFSPDTAIVTISNSEIDGFLTLTGLTVLTRTLVEYNGKSYEKILVNQSEQQNPFELFFDVSIAWENGFKSINLSQHYSIIKESI